MPKLQFVFGNPQKGKKKAKKGLAVGSKKRKHKRVTIKKRDNPMAKKKKSGRKVGGKKKNPYWFRAKKEGKKTLHSKKGLTGRDLMTLQKRLDTIAAFGDTVKSKKKKRANKAKATRWQNMIKTSPQKDADLKKWRADREAEGYAISAFEGPLSGRIRKKSKKKKSKKGASVAKRKKSKSKVKRAKRKASRRKIKVIASVGARKKSTSGKIRVKRRLGKGKSVSKSVKKGKKRFTVSLKRTNPFFTSEPVPMVSNLLGVSTNQILIFTLTGISKGLFERGIVEALKYVKLDQHISKVPYGFDLASIAVGAAVSKFAPKYIPGKTGNVLGEMGKAHTLLAIAGILQKLITPFVAQIPGMSGVMFTPMSGGQLGYGADFGGVRFTPMSGVRFTPMSGHGQMGAGQLGQYDVSDYGGGGGYTEDRKFSPADFGRLGQLDQSMA